MTKHVFLFLLLFVSLFAAGCTTGPTDARVATGEWGGTNVDLRVSDTASSARFKCGALGEITGPLVLDGSGHFDISGTYDPVLVLGGPRPARFTGTVNGTNMTLSVEAEGQPVGTFQLAFGIAGSFEPCNF